MSEEVKKMKGEIVYIDDDESIRHLVKRQLEWEEFSVSTFGAWQKALNFIKNKNPNLVLLDIEMPDRNGFDILKEIKIFSPDLPVVMVTGYCNPIHVQLACQLGACDYITKPIDWNYLRQIAYIYSFFADMPDR